MFRYIVKRSLVAVVTLFAVSVITFGMFFAVPSDPAALQCGKLCNPTQLEQVRRNLDLPKDPGLGDTMAQYGKYMKGLVAGRTYGQGETARECPAPCLGYSFRNGEPVLDIILRSVPVTASIATGGVLLWVLTGVALGIVSALRRGTMVDKAAIGFSLAGASTQIFFIGLMLQLLLVFTLGWLPIPSYTSPFENPAKWLGGMILPWITLAFINSAIYARLTRAQMIETLSEDFVRTARAKGLPKRTVQLRHALRAGITPIITIAGLDIGGALGGTVITENTFGLQGMGRISVIAAGQLNLPIVMATVLLAAFFIVLANVIVDVLYAVVDPRVKLG